MVAAKAEDGVPDARWGHSAVAWRGKLILFGGSNTQHCFNDVWLLDVSQEPERSAAAGAVWSALPAPLGAAFLLTMHAGRLAAAGVAPRDLIRPGDLLPR